jgi:hypothetical protein
MKTNLSQLLSRYLHIHLVFFIVIIVLMTCTFVRCAAQATEPDSNDPYLAAPHHFKAGLITTYTGFSPPPVLIGDLTYGFSNRFSMGLVGGTTGSLTLTGLKLGALLYQKENFRLLYRMTSVYYFNRDGKYMFDRVDQKVMPWILTMGLFDVEWKTRKGIRLAAGMGLLETHCVQGMINLLFHTGEVPAQTFDVFNTIQGSASFPLSSRLTLRVEAITALKGTQWISRDEHHVGPLTMYLNFVYAFH